jgi:hypothetical protein
MRLGHLSKRDIHEIEQEIILAITEAAIEEFGPIPTDEQEGTTRQHLKKACGRY